MAEQSRLNPDKPVIQHSTAKANVLLEAIIYEDNDLIAINKPAGFAVHGGSGIKLGVIETLRKARPKEDYLRISP